MPLFDKKGITPLMVTFLLVSFAVAVGMVVMNIGRAELEEKAQCPIEIGLRFSEVGGEEQLCLDKAKGQLFFSVENGINLKVEGLVVNLIGTQGALSQDLSEAKIEKAGVYLKYLPYGAGEAGEIRQVKIIPKVNLYDEELICQEKAIIREKVRECRN